MKTITHFKGVNCKRCGRKLDAHMKKEEGSNKGEQRGISICIYCGLVTNIVNDNLTPFTKEDWDLLKETDERIYNIVVENSNTFYKSWKAREESKL